MGKTHVAVQVTPKFRDDIMLFKIKTKAANLEEVLSKAFKLLKKHERSWNK